MIPKTKEFIGMEDKIVQYGLFLGKRFSAKQKQQFLAVANQEFLNMGYPSKVVTGEGKGKNQPMDLFAGELGKANTIYAAYYDTPAKVFWPSYSYYPFNGSRTFKEGGVPIYLPNLIAIAICVAVFVWLFGAKELGGAFHVPLLVIVVAAGLLITSTMTRGIANRMNMNRNTSGVLALLETARKMPEEKRKQCAFVLLDRGTSDNIGAKMVSLALPNTLSAKLCIVLDCISGDGEQLMIGYKENNQREAKKLADCCKQETIALQAMDEKRCLYTSAFFFPKCVIISRGTMHNGDLLVKQTATKRDVVIKEEHIDQISDMLVHYMK